MNSHSFEGFLRVAACVPVVVPGDVDGNSEAIKVLMDRAFKDGVAIAVFPELCLTGYTCADLFHQRIFSEKKLLEGLKKILEASEKMPGMVIAVGLPWEHNGSLYNCGAVICEGRISGLVPKTFLPNYGEFYERRWFAPAPPDIQNIVILGQEVTFGSNQIFRHADCTFALEICEDLWAPIPPSCSAALGGAEIIFNLSASNEVIGKHAYLISLIAQQSARTHSAYVYSSAGWGESSTDLVFAGNAIIAENGRLLSRSPRFTGGSLLQMADIDLDLLRHDRMQSSTWRDSQRLSSTSYLTNNTPSSGPNAFPGKLLREIDPHPFVPGDSGHRADRCSEIISIQTHGLARRLQATGAKKLVVGISGGLDSTLALLVAVEAFKMLGLDVAGIHGVTMPGFGTTGRTYRNAVALIERLGATLKEIPIAEAVRGHFKDIGHEERVRDLTYENCQARERTQILMDYAGSLGTFVLGTGDLSELALGWCTYNGDHMSMYGVNASVPKTLVKHLVGYFADTASDTALSEALRDIIDTPISPELLPADSGDDIAQKTEDLVGPYELHDFFLYHMLRHGATPRKIFTLTRQAFEEVYDEVTIKHWLRTFIRRFFSQQFKRSCMPDGPKVGSICLSPRGDWRMPSDASAAMWLKECDEL